MSSAVSSRSFMEHKRFSVELEQIMKKVPEAKVNDIDTQISVDPSCYTEQNI